MCKTPITINKVFLIWFDLIIFRMVNYVLCGLRSSVWSIMFRVVRHLIHGVNYLPCGSSSFVWFTIVVFYLPYGPHVPWCLFLSVWSIIQENVCNMYIFNTVILKQLENLEGASELRELAEFWYPFSSIGAFFKKRNNYCESFLGMRDW